MLKERGGGKEGGGKEGGCADVWLLLLLIVYLLLRDITVEPSHAHVLLT